MNVMDMDGDEHERLRRALEGWDDGPYMAFLQPSADALVRAAAIRPGDRVLDVGAGFGDPALDVAAIVGPRGRVVGVDHDAESVEIARRRAAVRRLTNVEFLEMDVLSLGFPENSFDVVMSRNVIVYFNDPLPFLHEQLRVLAPGGRLAVTVWGVNERNPLMTVSFQVLRRYEPPQPQAAAGATPGRLETGRPDVLEDALRRIGFVDTLSGVTPLALTDGPEVAQRYWEERRAGSPASQRVLAKLSPDEKRKAEAEIVALVRGLIEGGRATGEMAWAAGRKPLGP